MAIGCGNSVRVRLRLRVRVRVGARVQLLCLRLDGVLFFA